MELRARSDLRLRLSISGLNWDEEDGNVNEVIWQTYLLGKLDADGAGFTRGYNTARRDYT